MLKKHNISYTKIFIHHKQAFKIKITKYNFKPYSYFKNKNNKIQF